MKTHFKMYQSYEHRMSIYSLHTRAEPKQIQMIEMKGINFSKNVGCFDNQFGASSNLLGIEFSFSTS